jgi:hypothetical protein
VLDLQHTLEIARKPEAAEANEYQSNVSLVDLLRYLRLPTYRANCVAHAQLAAVAHRVLGPSR